MALITKDERQTVFDVLLENAGAISGLFDFLKANNLQELDVPAGEYLAPAVLKVEVQEYFMSGKVPVTPFVAFVPSTIIEIVLNFRPEDTVTFISIMPSMVRTFIDGFGEYVGDIEVSTDDVSYTPLIFPFIPTMGVYYFRRSEDEEFGIYTIKQG